MTTERGGRPAYAGLTFYSLPVVWFMTFGAMGLCGLNCSLMRTRCNVLGAPAPLATRSLVPVHCIRKAQQSRLWAHVKAWQTVTYTSACWSRASADSVSCGVQQQRVLCYLLWGRIVDVAAFGLVTCPARTRRRTVSRGPMVRKKASRVQFECGVHSRWYIHSGATEMPREILFKRATSWLTSVAAVATLLHQTSAKLPLARVSALVVRSHSAYGVPALGWALLW